MAAAALEPLNVDRWFDTVRRSASFATLPHSAFEATLDLLSGKYPSTEFAELRPRLVYDRDARRVTAVRYTDMRTGEEYEQPAGLVVLSAYVFGNTQQLLLAGIGEPYDHATGKGVVVRLAQQSRPEGQSPHGTGAVAGQPDQHPFGKRQAASGKPALQDRPGAPFRHGGQRRQGDGGTEG